MSSIKHNHDSANDCEHCPSRAQNPICSHEEANCVIEEIRTESLYKADQVIFYAGNMPLGLFSVQSGLIKLEMVSPKGNAHTLRLMGPGSILGYRSLFANEPYQATAIAVEDSTLCFIPKAELFEIAKAYPQITLNLMTYISKDLRKAEEKWMYQMDKEAPARVAEALLFLQDHFHDQNWTRKEIAEWAGTTPETVMRNLALFEKSGWISQVGRSIQVLNREKLIEKSKT